MSDQFEHLFTPVKLGSLTAPNRLVMSPHMNNHHRGTPGDCAYFRARAAGGAGVVVIASVFTMPFDNPAPGWSTCGTENGKEELRRTIDAIREGNPGAKAVVEMLTTMVNQLNVPSGEVPQAMHGYQPRTVTTTEIAGFVAMAAVGAKNCKDAGADGVELMASSGVELQNYMSKLYNRRTDDYGGEIDGRLRIVWEMVDAIHAACGDDYPVGMWFDVDEEVLGGTDLDEGVEICRRLAESGKFAWLRVTANNIKAEQGHLHYPSSYIPQGLSLYASAAVREAVEHTGVPVIACHNIHTAELAEQAIAEGQCDLVAMARPLIADPELPNKARNGFGEDILSCIGCVEACYQRFVEGLPIGCSVNSAAGRELEGPPQPTASPKKVLVVGGGLAGMEAARIAAERGHRVTLWEARDDLGGAVRLESLLPGLEDRGEAVSWMQRRMERAGVRVELGKAATAEDVKAFGADSVAIATGASFSATGITPDQMWPIPGYDSATVLTPEELLLDGKPTGDHVVVYDATGYVVGTGIAELLADQGKEVDLVSTTQYLGTAVQTSYVSNALAIRAYPKVTYTRDSAVTAIVDGSVELTNVYSQEESTIDDVDTVVLVTSRPPNDDLYHELLGQLPDVQVIGDANVSRYANYRMYEATQAGRNYALAL